MITTAITTRNVRLIVETIITSHTRIAYPVEHYAEGKTPHHRFSILISTVLSVRV